MGKEVKLQAAVLPRGPGERAATEEMHMQMRDGFPAIGSVVDHEAKSGIRQPFEFGDLSGGDKEMPEEVPVSGPGFSDPGDRTLGNHEDVNRRHGRDVPEGQAFGVLENNVRRDLARDDFLEKRHESWSCKSSARWLNPNSPRTKETISPRSPEQSRRQFFAERNNFTHR